MFRFKIILTILIFVYPLENSFGQGYPDLTILFDYFDETVEIYTDGYEIVINADGIPHHKSPYFARTWAQTDNGFYYFIDEDWRTLYASFFNLEIILAFEVAVIAVSDPDKKPDNRIKKTITTSNDKLVKLMN